MSVIPLFEVQKILYCGHRTFLGENLMNKIFVLILIATSMCFATRIGVLKGKSACAEQITIHLDTEDKNGSTGIVQPQLEPGVFILTSNLVANGIESTRSDITFKYCVLNVADKELTTGSRRVPYDYAVLMLDSKCPAGTYKFKRHHDTEDKGNSNYYRGNIYPNVVNDNADLYYCFVPASSGATASFPFEGYGIFANTYKTARRYAGNTISVYQTELTEFYIDDEDSGNSNGWDYYGYSNVSGISQIISGGKNTTMHVSYWGFVYVDGIIMTKASSAENPAAPASAEQLAAPTLKGFDHSAIAVDLKSAGDVRISVANVNGAVVANIVESGLQPGVHQIKWNSGAIPNGRYIVTIKQNGMVNAKNVILK